MLKHELNQTDGILILTPQGRLEASDFQNLAKEVDPYLEKQGLLRGVMVYAESFPGWSDFAALLSHLRFVRDHHQKIEKVAAVTDSGILKIAPRIASHFLHAKVKQFDYRDKDAALAWLKGGA